VTISLPTGQHVPKTASIVITRLDILAILSTQPRHVASLIRSNGMMRRNKTVKISRTILSKLYCYASP